jgi:hypothetical protein
MRCIKLAALTAAAALAVVAGAAACGTAVSPSASSSPAASSAVATGQLGHTVTVFASDGTAYTVAAMKVLDPAQASPDAAATPAPGTRFVGVEYVISATAGSLSEDARNGAFARGSDGQIYSAVTDGAITAGTAFGGGTGQITLAPGQSATGWVTFQIPDGVTVTSVEWRPNEQSNATGLTWNVS